MLCALDIALNMIGYIGNTFYWLNQFHTKCIIKPMGHSVLLGNY